MKKTLALACIVLMAGSLTACGGDDNSSAGGGGSYCDQIKTLKSNVDTLDFTALSDEQFSDLQHSLDGIEASAPADVKDDWSTLSSAIDQLKQILADAGLSFADLQAIQNDPTNLPDGVDIAKLQELAQKLQEFAANSDFEAASNAIQANVKDECGIELNDTSTTGS
jgi:hypothetical protein